MKTTNSNSESNNGMSQVINILTGEIKKIRCHYISHRTDKPVSRVLTLERLNHPALTAAGVTAWAERFNDGVNSFDWLRVSIQLTDKICYTPNCANVGLPDVENYGNLDYYKNQEGAMRVYMNNVDKFFQSIADKPAKMMTGEDWPNMAVIAAYKAAGRDKEAETLTAARDTYNARKEADKEAWSKKYAAQQYYYNSPKPKNFADLTELEKAQYMMETAQECAKEHPELDWNDVLERAAKRLEKAEKERKAQEWQEFLDREAEKQNSFAEGMRVTVPAASLTDGETFVIVTIRRKAADNGGNASLTVKNETTGDVRNINGSDVQDILPPLEPASEIKEAEGIKVGDKVRHNKHEEVATVTAIREAFVNGCDGYRYLYTLDFGQSVKDPFDVELNGGEFLREAFTVVPDYYSEYQKLGHQEARPTEWIEKATSEERETYYRACVELERMAGDGLPLVIRADSADLSVNPWNALDKRVKTARVFHLGDRVKVKDGSREVTGIVNGIRCNEGSLALGGWCTHYNIQWDKQYQYATGYGTATGCGNIGPERIELIERAEFCPEPTSEWLQPGEKVAHYLDYGDGTGDWLIGNVTGYELCDDGTVTVIYGEYSTPLAGMVKYQPEMDGKAA